MSEVDKADRDEAWLVSTLNKVLTDPEVKADLLPGGYLHGHTFDDLGKWFRILSDVLEVPMGQWFENRTYVSTLCVVRDALAVCGLDDPDFTNTVTFNLFYFGCTELSPANPMAVKHLVAPQLKLGDIDVNQIVSQLPPHPTPTVH